MKTGSTDLGGLNADTTKSDAGLKRASAAVQEFEALRLKARPLAAPALQSVVAMEQPKAECDFWDAWVQVEVSRLDKAILGDLLDA